MDILNSWAKHAEYLAPHDASPGFVAVVTVPAASTAADKRGSLSYQNRGCCDLPSPAQHRTVSHVTVCVLIEFLHFDIDRTIFSP